MRFGLGGGSRLFRGGASIGKGGIKGGIGIGPFKITGGRRSRKHGSIVTERNQAPVVSDNTFFVGVVVVILAVGSALMFWAAHLVGFVGFVLVLLGYLLRGAYIRNTGLQPPSDSGIHSIFWCGLLAVTASAIGTQSWMWYLHTNRITSVDEYCYASSALTIIFCYPYTTVLGFSLRPWVVLNWALLGISMALYAKIRKEK